MEGLIVSLLIFIFVWITFILYLCYKEGKNNYKNISENAYRIIRDIDGVSKVVNNHEKKSDSRTSDIKTKLSQSSQNLKSEIGKMCKTVESSIDSSRQRTIADIQSQSHALQIGFQQVHTSLYKHFGDELSDIKRDLLDVQKVIRDYKDEILRTQSQSFTSTENKVSEVQKEMREHKDEIQKTQERLNSNLEEKMQTTHKEEHDFILGHFQSEYDTLSQIQNSIKGMSELLGRHIALLKPLEESLDRLEILYNKITTLDQSILDQEQSLNGMLERHTLILEYTKELSTTSKDIYDLMKLVLMKSIEEQIKPITGK